MGRESLTASAARRLALAAQGFGRDRGAREVVMHDVGRCINTVRQFQIDSVNVVTRAHYMPLYSRLGSYDVALLARATDQVPRRLFEYEGHAASLIDVNLQPLLRFRMQGEHRDIRWASGERFAVERADLVAWVLDELGRRGPMTARQFEHVEERRRQHWGWNWSSVKTALEWLFSVGEVSCARRNSQFERVYDLTERVLPARVLNAPTPSAEESVRGLVRHAARALGIASLRCLGDYFRTGRKLTRAAISDLLSEGELLPVTVRGWPDGQLYLWHRGHGAATDAGSGAGEPVRLGGLRAQPVATAVRLPVPDRDLCPAG